MVEPKTGCAKHLELRPDLDRELASNSRQKKEPDARSHHIRIKLAVLADETRNLPPRRKGMPVHKNQMQANPQIGQPMRARHRIGCGRAADHQARGRQNAVPMGLFDSSVYSRIEPEVVRADNQASQLAISRLRRN
jgi:hypothetical protein